MVQELSTSQRHGSANLPPFSEEGRREDTLLPPPDGGYGWFCVVAQFLVNGFTWGVVASYGVYLAYYLSHDLFPEATPIDYAFIGGFNFAFALLVAPLATPLLRTFEVRVPMFFGIVVLAVGFISASFASKVWHLYVSQGLCVGIGVGLVYVPATSVIPQWFLKKRSLVNGICASGSGIGGLIISFGTQGLLDTVGLAWSLRITAVIVFFINLIATLLMRARNKDIKPSLNIFNFRLLASYEAKLLLGWSFVVMFGYITLMFSLPDYTLAIGRSHRDSATVIAILNLGTAIGRPLIGFLSDQYGRVEVAGIATLSCGILVFSLWLIPSANYYVLIIFSLISGSILGIFWVAIAPLAADIVGLRQLPSFLNIVWLSLVLPSLFAEVIALELRHHDFGSRSYIYAQIFTGLSYVIAALLLFELWRSRRGTNFD